MPSPALALPRPAITHSGAARGPQRAAAASRIQAESRPPPSEATRQNVHPAARMRTPMARACAFVSHGSPSISAASPVRSGPLTVSGMVMRQSVARDDDDAWRRNAAADSRGGPLKDTSWPVVSWLNSTTARSRPLPCYSKLPTTEVVIKVWRFLRGYYVDAYGNIRANPYMPISPFLLLTT